nr:peptide chain release factor aRF-1 [Methanophagales archaeon]
MDLEKREFQRLLEELRKKSGRGTELISVYIPPDRDISDVMSHLRAEQGQAMNIKSKSTRKNVHAALEAILSKLRYLHIGENGVAIFCGAVSQGGDKTDIEFYVVEPPEKITSYIYRCDSSFLLEPLERMLASNETFGLIVLDKREATIGILRGKLIQPLKHLTSSVPGKHRKGGQSAPRFQRLREIAIEDFYQRIGRHASEILLAVDDLKGVLIGGPSPTKEEFLKGNYLHYELRDKIIGVFDVAYTDESGLYELVDKAEDVLEGLELVKEKRLMSRFMKLLVNEPELVAYGEEEVRKKLEEGSVETLLLSESVPAEKMRELAELAEKTNAEVALISADFEEGSQLERAFKGIAAILRFKS